MYNNKKILFIVLGLSLHKTATSMEEAEIALRKHTDAIVHYMSEENSEERKQNILPLTEWLTEKRDIYYEDTDWRNFLKNNLESVKYVTRLLSQSHSSKVSGVTSEKIINVIIDRAQILKPNTTSKDLANTIDQDILVLYHACFKK